MEFDKSRVYTALNADELRAGDKVIVGDSLTELKGKLSRGFEAETLTEILDEDWYGRFEIGENNYFLAYLVERAKNCCNCGKHEDCGFIQNQSRFANLNRCEDWKPKTEQKAEKKYRPFRDTDELIKVWEKKWSEKTNGQKWHDCKLNMPLIWTRRKNDPKDKGRLITAFNDDCVEIGEAGSGDVLMMDVLFEMFTFFDGSPCGVEE